MGRVGFVAFGAALLALTAGSASSVLAQDRTGQLDWRHYVANAFAQASLATSATPEEIEAFNTSSQSARDPCSAMTRSRWTLPNTSTPLEVGFGFHGSCNAGLPTGALVLHASIVNEAGNESRTQFHWALNSARLGIGPVAVLGTTVPERLVETRSQLNALAETKLVGASALPPWPAGGTVPALPLGVSWHAGVERDLYEAIRARNHPVICLFNYNMLCGAFVPERGQRVVEVLEVSGLGGPYRLRRQADAIDVLTGVRPAITPQELAAWEAEEEAIMRRLGEEAMRNLN